jgi:opacity protein-like surface antigen
MKSLLIGMVALLLAAAALPAADVSGTWKGAFDFQGSQVPVTLQLKGEADVLTGTINGLPTDPAEIKEGKIKDDQVTFWVSVDYEGSTYKVIYSGKIAGDEIHFSMGTEDGSWGTDLVVKRS